MSHHYGPAEIGERGPDDSALMEIGAADTDVDDAENPSWGPDYQASVYDNEGEIMLVVRDLDGIPLGHLHLGDDFIRAVGSMLARRYAPPELEDDVHG